MTTESPLHREIQRILQKSELHPLNVEVVNESYFYLSRHILSPRKQMADIVILNQLNNRYEAYIFKLKMRETDGEYVPQRQFLT